MHFRIVVFALLLCTSYISAQTPPVQQLDTTAYADFFNANCTLVDNSYPTSCNPFAADNIWIPQGAPPTGSTLVVNSTTALIFVVPATISATLNKLTLGGMVQLIVEGTLVFSDNAQLNDSLVVCDTSSVLTHGSGIVTAHYAGFFDASSFAVADSATFNITFLHGNPTSATFTGGSANFQGVNSVQNLTVSGNASVSSYTFVQVQTFAIYDNAQFSGTVQVQNGAQVNGGAYYLTGLDATLNAVVTINQCPGTSLYRISASGNSTVTISTNAPGLNTCTFNGISQYDNSTIYFNGDNAITVKYLNSNYEHGFTGTSSMVFSQATTTNPPIIVNLPGSYGPTYMTFNGNFNVNGGMQGDQQVLLYLGAITVNGNVQFNASNVELLDTFAFVPNLNFTLPSSATMFIQQNLNLDQANFTWSPNSAIVVDFGGKITASNFVLNGGRTLSLLNVIDSAAAPSVEIANLTIAEGSSLLALNSDNFITGNVVVAGSFTMAPIGGGEGYFGIQGNLIVEKTGVLSIPQALADDVMSYSASCFLSVTGKATLDGTLTVSLGGRYPTNYTYENYTATPVPVMNATMIEGDFGTFNGSLTASFAKIADGHVDLSYAIANHTTVYLNLVKGSPSNNNNNKAEKWIEKNKWYVVGGGCGFVVLVAVIAGVAIARRRRPKYDPIA